ncbi:hypothetical protein KC622_00245, partial [Candidatus Dojkabacteria bacterium]|nr:hypothetical protein [Candidatus Dojkabacteria bacterium]
SSFKPEEIEKLQERISAVREQDMALKVSDLRISGEDIMKLGVKKGPEVGNILEYLLAVVIEEPILNSHESLLRETKDYLAGKIKEVIPLR